MDGLREISKLTSSSSQVLSAAAGGNQYEVVRMAAVDKDEVEFELMQRKEKSLEEFIQSDDASQSTLRLIHIDRRLDLTLDISQITFQQLLDAMEVDPCVQYLISRDYDGFHYYRDGEEKRFTGYVGMPAYVLIWASSLNTKYTKTTALFLHRRRNPFAEFSSTLRTFKELIHSPHLLPYVSALHMMHMFDYETNNIDLDRLRLIEHETGYGPSARLNIKTLCIDDLSSWSQVVGELQVAFANKLRALRVSEALLQFIAEEWNLAKIYDKRDTQHYPPRECTTKLNDTVTPLKRQMDTFREYMEYLKERAEKLSDVLFALMTHEDANISLRLVEEARRDSTSMKTIAVMTMAFLPATFFAALFAVPSLQWDKSPVVQDNFWVYWACAVPATVGVFLIWGWIMYKNHLSLFWKRRHRQ